MTTDTTDTTTYGLTYDDAFIRSLPPAAHTAGGPASSTDDDNDWRGPRTLSAAQFTELHLKHTLSHPPDHVIFPFMHGVEGDNPDQNRFFHSQTPVVARHDHLMSRKTSLAIPPRYRGLMWVLCEDDLDHPSQLGFLAKLNSSDEFSVTDASSEDDFTDDDYDLDDEDEEMDDSSSEGFDDPAGAQMDVDVQVNIVDAADSVHNGIDAVVSSDTKQEEKHRHPVQHRAVAPIQTSHLDISAGPPSATDSTSGTADSSVSPSASSPTSASAHKKAKSKLQSAQRKGGKKSKPQPVPLLTCSFRESDIIRPCLVSNDSEFCPLHVPDGISLRNFGIQVPIMSTLSDFVVYSPKGRSPAACALARRLQSAIDLKRQERIRRLGSDDHLLDYNVFVLDATADEISRHMPHLVARLHEGSVPLHRSSLNGIASASASPRPESPPPTGSDFEMDMDMSSLDVHMSASTATLPSPPRHPSDRTAQQQRHLPNTVDFASREREEMRDLTRATEIISVFPPAGNGPHAATRDLSSTAREFDPTVGQVFLGNSNDVPICKDNQEQLDLSWELIAQLGSSKMQSQDPNSASKATLSESPCSSVSSMGNDGFSHLGYDSSDMPLPSSHPLNHHATNSPTNGQGYDICIECHDMAPFPSISLLRAAEEKIDMLETLWRDHHSANGSGDVLPVRPPPNANSVVHLPFPSSPSSTNATMASLMPVIRFIERCLSPPVSDSDCATLKGKDTSSIGNRRWSSVASLLPNLPSFPLPSATGQSSSARSRAYTTSSSAPPSTSAPQQKRAQWSRPLKVLLYSADGYTESSVPALCLLMAIKNLSLPEAYLELQVVKRRSFFVYQGDLGVLRRVESRMTEERRERENQRREQERVRRDRERSASVSLTASPTSGWGMFGSSNDARSNEVRSRSPRPSGRPAAKSVSFARNATPTRENTPSPEEQGTSPALSPGFSSAAHEGRSNSVPSIPLSASVPGSSPLAQPNTLPRARRARANTSPWLPSLFGGDHQAWFNDPRFEGSFPSRVLPFLYLGNLAHASNAYMLHALGITHVVSVGECALVPPPNMQALMNNSDGEKDMHFSNASSHSHFVKGSSGQGSLWIEERAGRIKVLDIQGVCDDGIDTLEPQLEPICEWIDKARKEGGQVLVHCRVGVSRSATVTIAYVMKHLNISLVEAYLIVRSRRLSVLIQPNMRLLYNLCGWEIKLAQERAGDDHEKLKHELSSTVTWPYLAKEVHKLNEKYLVH